MRDEAICRYNVMLIFTPSSLTGLDDHIPERAWLVYTRLGYQDYYGLNCDAEKRLSSLLWAVYIILSGFTIYFSGSAPDVELTTFNYCLIDYTITILT